MRGSLQLLAQTQPHMFMRESTLSTLFECIERCGTGETDEVHSLVLSIFSTLGKAQPISSFVTYKTFLRVANGTVF